MTHILDIVQQGVTPEQAMQRQRQKVAHLDHAHRYYTEISHELDDNAVYECGYDEEGDPWYRKLETVSRTPRTITVTTKWRERNFRLKIEELDRERGVYRYPYHFQWGRNIRQDVGDREFSALDGWASAYADLEEMEQAMRRGEYPYTFEQEMMLDRLEEIFHRREDRRERAEKVDWRKCGF